MKWPERAASGGRGKVGKAKDLVLRKYAGRVTKNLCKVFVLLKQGKDGLVCSWAQIAGAVHT